jgi:GDPmannose 4,6-dehydratase
MFGNSIDDDGFQRETTPFKPANPYACAKQFSHNICINYRNSYNLFISNGILFNHESPRRGENFVTSKIIKGAIAIYNGTQSDLRLGTLDTYRDWGHAKDYTRAMWTILQQDSPGDYICATGITHSIKELCEYVFLKLNLDYKEYIVIDQEFVRPEETVRLKGDSTKLRTLTGWEPEYTFESMIDEMIEYYLNKN